MKVFVTGASGYIGGSVAAALARAGYEVFGLVRDARRAERLAAAEVQPLFGDMERPASYVDTAAHCQVLVHCAAEYGPRQADLDRATVQALLDAGTSGRPVLFVYTSGTWIYGSSGEDVVDEQTPPAVPDFLRPRAETERLVLGGLVGSLRTLVVRPGVVYGGSGGLTGAWFESAVTEGAARYVGDGTARWPMVHIDDLADLYVRLAESAYTGEIFNATDRSRFRVAECARAASRAAGAGGKVVSTPVEEAAKTLGPVAQALTFDQHVDARKAVRMLGWQPRHGGFADGAARYFRAWRAGRA